jgi:AcrR family transcriptional regulator
MVSKKGRKDSQRERLILGMTETAAQDGYAAANIARVIAHAGVSRPTFYTYFPDREACFIAAHREHAAKLAEQVEQTIAEEDPARSLHAALEAIVEFTRAESAAARLLMHEASTAGAGALHERDQAISGIARAVERRRQQAATDAQAADVYAPAIIGSVYRLLSLRLRRGERDLVTLTREIQEWLGAYQCPAGESHWGTLEDLGELPSSPSAPTRPLHAPAPLPSGRAGLSPEQVAHNHRERILFACLQASAQRGYTATTVADITNSARLDKRVFYQHFRSKEDAFHATLDHAFAPTIAATATAYFSAPTWPERLWEAGRAFTEFFAANPTLAQFAFIDAYTIGPTAIQRFDDLRSAYTIFLQEGRQHPNQITPRPSDTALEAIAAAVFEIAYNQIRRGRTDQLTRLLPHVAHLCLTPFLGTPATERFIATR